MIILRSALAQGSKWARFARKLGNRTEHSVKNRFFSLLHEYLEIPIAEIKKELHYMSKEIISETIVFYEPEPNSENENNPIGNIGFS